VEVFLVRALRLAEMAMKIDVAIGVVVNRNRPDSFVDDYFVNSGTGDRALDLFQGGWVPLADGTRMRNLPLV
jgi:hypothetical protein